MPLSQLMFALTLAIYISTYFRHHKDKPRKINLKGKKIISAVLIFTSLTTIILLGYESYKRIDNNFYQGESIGTFGFWLGQNCLGEVRYLRDGSINTN